MGWVFIDNKHRSLGRAWHLFKMHHRLVSMVFPFSPFVNGGVNGRPLAGNVVRILPSVRINSGTSYLALDGGVAEHVNRGRKLVLCRVCWCFVTTSIHHSIYQWAVVGVLHCP